MSNQSIRPDFEALYRSEQTQDGLPALTPWDIGRPQPAVEQLVAYGALQGNVLDPGTGPGHHAIHFASKGYSVTGIDASAAGIERAKRNAERAGVTVDFQVADATKLDGFENRFDTVVDSAFYHVFFDDEEKQNQYVRALHRACKPGARLYMFEIGIHDVNGLRVDGLAADTFKRVLSAGGWRIDYLGTATYQARFSQEVIAAMSEQTSAAMSRGSAWTQPMRPLLEQLGVIEPLLHDHLVHMPVWAVHATRID